MKKALLIGLLLLLTISCVSAANNNFAGQEQHTIQTVVNGLDGATIKYQSQEQVQTMEAVMNQMMTHQRAMLAAHNDLTFKYDRFGELIATGTSDDLFLGLFRAQHKYKYVINQDTGFVSREKRPFADMFWKED